MTLLEEKPIQTPPGTAAGPYAANRIEILAVGQSEAALRSLRAIFRHSNWNLFTAGSIAETLGFLDRGWAPVVLCERDLADGSWADLLAALPLAGRAPHLIVTSRLADERLWAEVLNSGGYDVLSKPFRTREVFQVLGLAWHHSHDRKRTAAGAA